MSCLGQRSISRARLRSCSLSRNGMPTNEPSAAVGGDRVATPSARPVASVTGAPLTPSWNARSSDCRMSRPDLVLGLTPIPLAKKRKVTITGFFEGPRTGTVIRVGGQDGRDILQSDERDVGGGMERRRPALVTQARDDGELGAAA